MQYKCSMVAPLGTFSLKPSRTFLIAANIPSSVKDSAVTADECSAKVPLSAEVRHCFIPVTSSRKLSINSVMDGEIIE
jgi:hypothetical protein